MVSSGFFRPSGRPRVGVVVLTLVAAGLVLPAGGALGAEEQPRLAPATGEKAQGRAHPKTRFLRDNLARASVVREGKTLKVSVPGGPLGAELH